MKYLVFAVRDRAADAFGTPQYNVARGSAIRSFSDAINSGSDALANHPEDFDLYELGSFDDRVGLFETGVPQMIAVGKDLRVEKGVGQAQLPLNGGGRGHASQQVG